jgi:hypothetical membrane protein
MSDGLVEEFIGWLLISFILFILFFIGAVTFGKNIPAEQLVIAAGVLGLFFYALFKGINPRR